MELSRFAEKQQCLSSAVEFLSFAYDQAHRVGGISLNDALEAYKRAVTKVSINSAYSTTTWH